MINPYAIASRLLRELGFRPRGFASAEEFLAPDAPSSTRCLLLDIAMLGMPGPELHNELIRRGHSIPVIFIAGRRQALPMSFEKR